MNHYFRLLFVGSILFVLLGLFNKQSEKSLAHNQGPEEIENVEIQAGILPTHFVPSLDQTIPSTSGEQPGETQGKQRHQEYHFGKNTKQQFALYAENYLNCKPMIICMTGQFLHLAEGHEVPSHI